MAIPETVTELLGPVVATLGVELVDVEWSGSTLRVVVDAEDRITTEQLTQVNRLVSPILDQHDPIPGRYTLEVSSPGVERVLHRFEHYRRAIGEDVVVKMQPGIEPRRFKGTLRAATETTIELSVVEIDGVDLPSDEMHEIVVDDVAKARTVFNWGPGPKPGKKPAGQNKKKSASKKNAPGNTAKNTAAENSTGARNTPNVTTKEPS